MGVIVLEGLVVTVLVLVGLREAIMRAVPMALKRAIGVGIGLFILFIGFIDAGIIVKTGGSSADDPGAGHVRLPDRARPLPVLAGPPDHRRPVGAKGPGGAAHQHPRHDGHRDPRRRPEDAARRSWRPRTSPRSATSTSATCLPCSALLAALLTIFSFMLTDFFDTMGTATAISEQAGLVDEDGQPKNVGRILLVDSVGAAVGGAAGISSNTSYIESAAGVAEGGRTGFTSVVTGLLFLAAILLTPLAVLVPYVATGRSWCSSAS